MAVDSETRTFCALPLLIIMITAAAELQAGQEPLPNDSAAHSARALLGTRPRRGSERQRVARDGGSETASFFINSADAEGGWFATFSCAEQNGVLTQARAGFSKYEQTGDWDGECVFPVNGATSLVRLFEGARPRLQMQGTLSTECTFEKTIDRRVWESDTCTVTINGGRSTQCTDAQAPTCSADRSQSTPTALIVEKSRFCAAQPAAPTAFMTLNCTAKPGFSLSGVYQLSTTSFAYIIRSVKPRGKPTPAP
jgi:hypothetical protein